MCFKLSNGPKEQSIENKIGSRAWFKNRRIVASSVSEKHYRETRILVQRQNGGR